MGPFDTGLFVECRFCNKHKKSFNEITETIHDIILQEFRENI